MYTVYLKKVEESLYILGQEFGAGPSGGRKCNLWSGDDSVKIWWTPKSSQINTSLIIHQFYIQGTIVRCYGTIIAEYIKFIFKVRQYGVTALWYRKHQFCIQGTIVRCYGTIVSEQINFIFKVRQYGGTALSQLNTTAC